MITDMGVLLLELCREDDVKCMGEHKTVSSPWQETA